MVHMQAGAFKIGDTAGTLDNIIACKLYRPGSVGFVSKSGGMSNEMYNVLARATDGLYEGKQQQLRDGLLQGRAEV
jgi:ATP citrate (pro-S)-lyase